MAPAPPPERAADVGEAHGLGTAHALGEAPARPRREEVLAHSRGVQEIDADNSVFLLKKLYHVSLWNTCSCTAFC